MNIVEQLIDDHEELIVVMEKLGTAIDKSSEECDKLFQNFKDLFRRHDDAEDKIFYPALKKHTTLKKMVLKGYQAHHVVEVGILELRLLPYNSESWGPKFAVIKDSILQHMEEEEEELFPKALELLSSSELSNLSLELNKLRGKQ